MISLLKPILILNKSWVAIRTSTVKVAIKIVFAGRASFVDKEYTVYDWEDWSSLIVEKDEEFIQSVRKKIKIPEVIVLKTYSHVPIRRLRLTKRNLMIRDKYVCQYTGKPLKPSELDIDHVLPQSKGGKNSWDNMVVTSIELNRKKDNKTTEEAGLKLIRKPTEPKSKAFFLDPRMIIPKSWKNFIDINKI